MSEQATRSRPLTKRMRAEGIARENGMLWAMQTSTIGEDPMAILARAQLYEEYILAKDRDGGSGF